MKAKAKRPRKMTRDERVWFLEADGPGFGEPSFSVYMDAKHSADVNWAELNQRIGCHDVIKHIDGLAIQLCCERAGLVSGETTE